MFKDIKKLLAFSLFEMLLVLVVTGIIALSAIKYAAQQRKDRIADVLAHKMYFFSQATRAFVSDNPGIENGSFPCPTVPDSTCTNTNGQYVFTGVTWLTTLTDPNTGESLYLKSDFTFNDLYPLELQNNTKIGDQAVIATMVGNEIFLSYGMLYDIQDPVNPQPQAAIAGEAAEVATHLYDPQIGPSTFSYVGGLQADGNLMPIQATLGIGGVSDAYLRLDGSSAMRGDIVFDQNAASKNVTGVDQVTFNNAGSFTGLFHKGKYRSTGREVKLREGRLNNICYLTQVQVGGSGGKCEILERGDDYYLRGDNGADCWAECWQFR